MSFLTTITRMWLTRSLEPFRFRNEYDEALPFQECERLGLYVHIPFCKRICSFCPYCKVPYREELCNRYIDALLREIHMIGGQYEGQFPATSLYFGGGTPALAHGRIGEVVSALREHFVITDGIGLELHPDNVTVSTLEELKAAGVTKISIGVQSFHEKYQRILGRKSVRPEALSAALSAVPFETVSMDFIFALPGQTFDDIRADLETAFRSGANCVAIYPFIDFDFTPSDVPVMRPKEKRVLLDKITRYCAEQGWKRETIWTFSSVQNARYSSMTRESYLGFGCSAVSLLRQQFKVNTFSVEEYCRRIDAGKLPTSLTLRFTERQRMVYWLFWTAYGMRVDSRDFEHYFGVPLRKMYGAELAAAIRAGLATEKDGVYEMTDKGAFYYHYYENFYTLAYIDKMWGILREEAFPESLTL